MGSPRLGNPRRLPTAPPRSRLAPPAPPTISRVAVRREYPPDKMAIRIDAPNGFSNRWAEDEAVAQNVLSNIEFEDEIPGGDKSLSGLLARNPQFRWRDDEAYAEITAYQPGVNKVFEGFLDKEPDVSGDQMSITPAALGNQSILDDDQGAGIGFIDCPLSKWGDPSSQRRKNVIKGSGRSFANTSISDGFAGKEGLSSGKIIEISHWDESPKPTAEAWYYGEGQDIGAVLFDYNIVKAAGTELLENRIYLVSDDVASTILATSAKFVNAEVLNQRLNAGGAGAKYALLNFVWSLGGTGDNNGDSWAFTNLKILGNQGLSLKGAWPNVGFTVKQMIEYLIPRLAAPLEVRSEDIDDDEYIINQAWYGEKGSTSEIVQDLLKYSLYDWFVKGKRFKIKKPGTYGRFWKAYVRESQLNEIGIDSQALWDQIIVKFQDASGRTLYVGPPGSGCEVESELLQLSDPDHPAVRAGRKRRSILDLKGISNPAQAIEVGVRFLEEAALLNHAGSATLSGYVMDHYGVFWPAACVKSGDWISFVDAADSSYRKIVNRKYVHNNRGAEIDIDAPPSGMEALLERLQAALIPLGVS